MEIFVMQAYNFSVFLNPKAMQLYVATKKFICSQLKLD